MSGHDDQTGDSLTAPAGGCCRAWVVLLVLGLAGIIAFDQFVGRVWSPSGSGVGDVGAAAHYGAWVLTPAVVTIVLAIALRQVIPALSIGVLVASIMLVPFSPAGADFGGGLVGSARLAVEHYLIGGVSGVGALTDSDHVKVIVFSLSDLRDGGCNRGQRRHERGGWGGCSLGIDSPARADHDLGGGFAGVL